VRREGLVEFAEYSNFEANGGLKKIGAYLEKIVQI